MRVSGEGAHLLDSEYRPPAHEAGKGGFLGLAGALVAPSGLTAAPRGLRPALIDGWAFGPVGVYLFLHRDPFSLRCGRRYSLQ